MERVRHLTASFSELRQQVVDAAKPVVAEAGSRVLGGAWGGAAGVPAGEAPATSPLPAEAQDGECPPAPPIGARYQGPTGALTCAPGPVGPAAGGAAGGSDRGPRLSPRMAAMLASHNVRGGAVLDEFRKLDPASYTETHELRVVVGTWNLNGRRPPEGGLDLAAWLDADARGAGSEADLYVVGLQEVVPLSTQNVLADGFQREIAGSGYEMHGATVPWEAMIDDALNRRRCLAGEGGEEGEEDAGVGGGRGGRRWVPLCRKQLVGVYLTVWASAELHVHIHDVKMVAVGCGVLGVLGNKGAVVASMRVYDTTLCLVCSHLSSGDQGGDAARRSADIAEILRRAEFPPATADDAGAPRWIGDHQHAIWLGDLNYRLSGGVLGDSDVRRLIAAGDWSRLLEADELRAEVAAGRAFPSPQWREGPITFPPTYKLRRGTVSEYAGDPGGGEGEKVRTPAWTDRVLYTPGEGCVELAYSSAGEYTASDHKPVCCVLAVPFHFHPPDLVEAAVGAARRAGDAAEMAARPRCDLAPASLDLGALAPMGGVEGVLTLANTGGSAARFEFLGRASGEAPVAWPSWVAVEPGEGEVEAGGQVELSVRARREGVEGEGTGGRLEAILVLRVRGGRDFFVTVSAQDTGTGKQAGASGGVGGNGEPLQEGGGTGMGP